MAGCVERPSRLSLPSIGRRRRRDWLHWLLPSCVATLVHLAVLAMIALIPERPAPEDGTPQAEPVMLLLEKPAAEALTNTAQPGALSTPAIGPEPMPEPLSADPAPPEQPPLPPRSEELPPLPRPEEPPLQPVQPVEPIPAPPTSPPRDLKPRPVPAEQPASLPPVRKTMPRPPVAEARPAPAPAGARPEAGPTKPIAPADTRQATANANLLGNYQKSLAEHVKAYQHYPALARTRREEGLVVVHVTIRRDGRIAAMWVGHGSGSDRLDSEALATLKRADPLPAMPAAIAGETIELTFPLRFHLE